MKLDKMNMSIVAGFFWLLLLNIVAEAEEMADTIYHNGAILSMAVADPNYVAALAVKTS